MSLQGRRIVVTRAPHQAGRLADLLRGRGAEPLLFPCIDIAPPDDPTPLDNAIQTVSAFDWLLVTSTNTVAALRRRFDDLGLSFDMLALVQVAAVGIKTASYARKQLGVTVEIVPEDQTAEGLAAAMPDVIGQRVLLPQSDIARDVLGQLLVKAGADVTQVVAYQTVTGLGGVDAAAVHSADALTFTSPSTVYGFVERMGGVVDLPAACIGPITEKAAVEAGFTQVVTPTYNYNLTAMLDVLEQSLLEKTS